MASAPTPHSALMLIIGQSVFVVILSEVANFSDTWGLIATTFILGLWLVYLINSGPALMSTLKGKVGLP
jgi:hypothetical protein